jgi:ABC-2 type transport system ATP-binding protein
MRICGQALSLLYDKNRVFENLSFEVDKGIWLVKGSNGSGKTSLCRMVCGLLKPTKGHIEWLQDDKSLQKQDLLGRIGFTTPEMGLYEELTVSENISFFESISNSKINDVFGISRFGSKLYSQLSSGWKQRLKILVAFLGNPELLVLDEPEQHLDEAGVAILTDMISSRKGLTIVSTNNPWMNLPVLVDLGAK